MKTQVSSRLAYFLIVSLVSLGVFLAVVMMPLPRRELAFQTGPITFMALGGVVSSFSVVFDELGDKPIEEYGIVYTFDEDVKDNYPDLTDKKVEFDLPAKQYTNEKTANVGFPAGAHWFGYRAYAKLKDGGIKYAEPVIMTF